MADLMSSLLTPDGKRLEYKSSEESFHSITNELPNSSLSRKENKASVTIDNHEPAEKGQITSSVHEIGQAVDVDTFLKSLESSIISKSTYSGTKQSSADPLRPVELNTTTNHYVATLNNLCQANGISPIFDINGEADKALFGGTLKVGDQTFTLQTQCRSKKEAKERLAESAIGPVKAMGPQKRDSTQPDENWVGKLQEYHNSEFGSARSPEYTYYALGLSFACTCKIASHPDRSFGASTAAFSTKKQARTNAASEAVKFLIAEGKLNPDGSTLSRKKTKLGQPGTTTTATPAVGTSSSGDSNGGKAVKFTPSNNRLTILNETSSHAQRVNDLCPLLGLTPPQYHMTPVSTNAPSMLSGYAVFPNNNDALYLSGKIGEVRNVFGKKDTREEIAKAVWDVLIDLAKSRGVNVDSVE